CSTRSTGQSNESNGANVFLTFEGACEETLVDGINELPGRYHYFLGDDPAQWHTDVSAYSVIRYRALYPGVDMEVREGDGASIEYDLILEPGVDLDQVVIRCQGAESLSVDHNRSLILQTAAGTMEQR